jgi:hypothetical protein
MRMSHGVHRLGSVLGIAAAIGCGTEATILGRNASSSCVEGTTNGTVTDCSGSGCTCPPPSDAGPFDDASEDGTASIDASDAGPTDGDIVDSEGLPWLTWSSLQNPILSIDGWSIKDVAVTYRQGRFYFFFSAFFCEPGVVPSSAVTACDGGTERPHIATTSTADMKTFTTPTLLFESESKGWDGLISPDLVYLGGERYVLTFSSWGERAGQPPTQLFHSESSDLVHWGPMTLLAGNVTKGRVFDGVLALEHGNVYLLYKQGGVRPAPDTLALAVAPTIDSDQWKVVGTPTLLTQSGKDNGAAHGNFHFIAIAGKWYLLTTDSLYGSDGIPYVPFFYRMEGVGTKETDWLRFIDGYPFTITLESFNISQAANGASIMDWTSHDGYYYLFYAGRTEGDSHIGRGDNKFGVSRSRDLKTWVPAGE